jgi:DedD protein
MTRRRRGRGASTLLVVLGLVAVFGGTFGAGFLAGRHWERVSIVAGLVKPQAGRERERAARERTAQGRSSDAPAVPPLTFYQELTAPLASPPPRAVKSETSAVKPFDAPKIFAAAKPSAPATKPVETTPKALETTKPSEIAKPPLISAKPSPTITTSAPTTPSVDSTPPTLSESRAANAGGSSYTIQVAAYNDRAQADALAARLAKRGVNADVVSASTPSGIRYRVRIGAYPTRQAAREAMSQLAESGLGGFVAVR